MKVLLRVDKGANHGTRYELPLHTFRAVGRVSSQEETVELAMAGEYRLGPDDLALVRRHLHSRGPALSVAQAAGVALGAYRRGRDILVEDDMISRTHAMFFFDEDGPSVVDLRSTNGTYVNGAQRTDADLREGDIVHVGKTRFVVEIDRTTGVE